MMLETIFSRCQQIKFLRPKNLPENPERTAKEKEILKNLLPILVSDFAEKFRYAKSVSEKENVPDIIYVLQKYFRSQLLSKLEAGKPGSRELAEILGSIEDVSKKLSFTNASQRLALEVLLMEI